MISPRQQEFAHWYGLIAGTASIVALFFAIRANIKLNGRHKKADEPLLQQQQLLGQAPDVALNPDGTPAFPVKKKPAKRMYYVFAKLPYCDHDKEAVQRVTRAIGRKVGPPFELCDWSKKGLFLVYPNPLDSDGYPKMESKRLARRAMKEVENYPKGRVTTKPANKGLYKYLGIRHGKA